MNPKTGEASGQMISDDLRLINRLRQHLEKAALEDYSLKGVDRPGILKRIQELLDFYEFAPASYLKLDKNGRIRSSNLTATVLLRTPRAELIGKSLYAFVIRKDRDTLFLHLRHLFKEKKPNSCELKIKGPREKPIWVRLDSLFDEDYPKPPQSLTTLMDISQQKQDQSVLAQLAAIVQFSEDAVIRKTMDGIITHWNPAAEKIYGYSAAEAVGQNVDLIIPPERLEENHKLVRRVLGGEQIKALETVRRTKDGRKIDIALSLAAIRGDKGEITALATIERDISKRVANRRRLNRIQEELQLATRAAQIGTWFADPQRGISQWNDQLYRLLGLDPRSGPEDLEYFFSFIHPDDRRGFLQNARAFIDDGNDEIEDEFRIIRADGQIRWLAVRGKIFRNASGVPVYMAGINSDITVVKEARQAEQDALMQLATKVAQLEQKNEELDQFAYAASHDLKAPLRAICNYSDFLNEDLAETLSGEQKRYLEGLKIAATQGQALIDDLLAYARIGRVETEAEKIDMPAMINEVKSYLNLPSEIDLTVQKDWPVIETDPMLLSQILKNLVGNAVKFSHPAPKQVDIGWRRNDQNGSVEIFVRDNGVGIDPKYQQQIFGIFQRLHTSREYDGTGIGLAIVKKAAIELGGAVRVESTPGEGSTFFVEIPKRVE
jgi:PAS domain S-box-containing protein